MTALLLSLVGLIVVLFWPFLILSILDEGLDDEHKH